MSNMYSLFALIFVASMSNVSTLRPVIVLSFEGFHPKYLTESDTPYLYNEILPKSAGPPFMTSVFPTKAAVTHFSVATGGYPEDHGVYGDSVFDDKGNIIQNAEIKFKRNNDIKPIWTEVEESGNHSAVMMWPGSEFEYHGKVPFHVQTYDKDMSWENRVDKIMEWMRDDDKLSLVMAYFEFPQCYDKRKQDEHFRNFKKKVDDTIKKMHTEISVITKDVDMIFMSDHGTEPVEWLQTMKESDYLTDDLLKMIDKFIVSGPLVYVKPKKNYFDAVNQNFKYHKNYDLFFTVETIDTFPSDLRLKANSLKDIIVLIAENGLTFHKEKTIFALQLDVGGRSDNLVINESGYYTQNPNMNALFLAVGPSFKEKVTTRASFNIVDIYGLLRHLLKMPDTDSSDQGKQFTLKKSMQLLLKEFVINNDKVNLLYHEEWRDWRLNYLWDE